MAVASLVLGILGLTVFCWLGPLLGGLWAGAEMAGGVLDGKPEIISWPLWALGVGIGVVPSVLAILFGIGSLVKGKSHGVAIGGIVTGVISAAIGFFITFGAVTALEVADDMVDLSDPNNPQLNQQLQQLTNDLNDPLKQKQLQDRLLKAAGDQQPGQNEPKPMQLQPMTPPSQPASDEPAPAQPPTAPQP